eukprot:CAMPEP_0119547984 /NCGR_PEP_ID=MMETSP1352-20130426/2008_1 /TAXON_ID=265584 /ORGANISM="Stauroneis constricta, Strain CCMP1120" /LENGTH=261 /DNA_ID=CAMNT_0007593123 /DNA_START=96 /DNA_END=881 /DNA_ORIENTATION=+
MVRRLMIPTIVATCLLTAADALCPVTTTATTPMMGQAALANTIEVTDYSDLVSFAADVDEDGSVKIVPRRSSSSRRGDDSDSLPMPPVIQSIADERREFQLNLGKAMDTIRKDMPEILRKQPDYSIYHKDITVVDPSGVTVRGIDNYRSSIKFLQTFISFWFKKERSGLQFRMVYDFCRSSIKVSWNAVLIPKVPLGKPVYVDGISVYKLNPESGKIIEHKFENLIINNTPVVPPYGLFSMMQQDLVGLTPQRIPGIPAGI